MALRILILLTLCVTACGLLRQQVWIPPAGGTEEQTAQDKHECYQEALAKTAEVKIRQGGARGHLFYLCMRARGYTYEWKLRGLR